MTCVTLSVIMCHDGCDQVPLFNHTDRHDGEFTTWNWQYGSDICSHTHRHTCTYTSHTKPHVYFANAQVPLETKLVVQQKASHLYDRAVCGGWQS